MMIELWTTGRCEIQPVMFFHGWDAGNDRILIYLVPQTTQSQNGWMDGNGETAISYVKIWFIIQQGPGSRQMVANILHPLKSHKGLEPDKPKLVGFDEVSFQG